MFSGNASVQELIADGDRVRHINGEGDGSALLAVFMPMFDNVADQLGGVHPAGELRDDVVALLGSHAFEIGIDGRIDSGFHEIAANNQFRDLRRLNHHVEQIAETSTVATARSRRHAQQTASG